MRYLGLDIYNRTRIVYPRRTVRIGKPEVFNRFAAVVGVGATVRFLILSGNRYG